MSVRFTPTYLCEKCSLVSPPHYDLPFIVELVVHMYVHDDKRVICLNLSHQAAIVHYWLWTLTYPLCLYKGCEYSYPLLTIERFSVVLIHRWNRRHGGTIGYCHTMQYRFLCVSFSSRGPLSWFSKEVAEAHWDEKFPKKSRLGQYGIESPGQSESLYFINSFSFLFFFFFEILSDLNQAVPNHLADKSQIVCRIHHQNLKKKKKKTFWVGSPQSPFSISSSLILFFVLLPLFLSFFFSLFFLSSFFLFPSSSFAFLFFSLSFYLQPFVCAKKRIFAFILSFSKQKFYQLSQKCPSQFEPGLLPANELQYLFIFHCITAPCLGQLFSIVFVFLSDFTEPVLSLGCWNVPTVTRSFTSTGKDNNPGACADACFPGLQPGYIAVDMGSDPGSNEGNCSCLAGEGYGDRGAATGCTETCGGVSQAFPGYLCGSRTNLVGTVYRKPGGMVCDVLISVPDLSLKINCQLCTFCLQWT